MKDPDEYFSLRTWMRANALEDANRTVGYNSGDPLKVLRVARMYERYIMDYRDAEIIPLKAVKDGPSPCEET